MENYPQGPAVATDEKDKPSVATPSKNTDQEEGRTTSNDQNRGAAVLYQQENNQGGSSTIIPARERIQGEGHTLYQQEKTDPRRPHPNSARGSDPRRPHPLPN